MQQNVALMRFNALFLALGVGALSAGAAPVEPLYGLAQKEKGPFLDTLKELVSIESGSKDREGLDRISALIADRLRALGGKVALIEPGADIYRMFDTPEKPGRMVEARFEGKGTKKILLIAHMDTVYLKGMLAQQPFRVDGNRAYGLGIADDKQGVALILHTLALLKATGFRDYGLVTVFIDGDEEVSAPASRALFGKLGSEHDATFSCERSSPDDQLGLTTAGIAAITLEVRGKASHAGAAPEQGRNALYELGHQILQTRDFSDPATGLKMNWTLANAGTNRNVIPELATAVADVRVLRVADFEGLEAKVRERMAKHLIPDTTVEMKFERRRPPLQLSPGAEALAKHAQKIYGELGKKLNISTVAEGGGTDAAFAALKTDHPVIERFGVIGFGAHSNSAESIDVDSIVPRLYLLTRMVMDVSRNTTQ
jgi:glutamate carboxypeptidase